MALVILKCPIIYAQEAAPAEEAVEDSSDNSSYTDDDVLIMDDMQIREYVDKETDAGTTSIDQDMINAMPKGNGSITDLMRMAPSVQYDEAYRSTNNAGEIAPAEVSISGGKPYENLYTIDGVSNSSTLDPANNDPYSIHDVPGHSQKVFIDSSLLEEIVIYDSNVPIRYDGFSGGVVDAKTRKPTTEFGGNISYRTTQSGWTNTFLDERDGAVIDSALEPDFIKHFLALSFDIPVGADTGIIASYNHNYSRIGKPHFNGYHNETRRYQNFFAKAVHNINGSSYIDFRASYAPQTEDYFLKNVKDSDFTVDKSAIMGGINYYNDDFAGKLQLHANYTYSENSREAPEAFKAWINTSFKPWGGLIDSSSSREGAYGSIDKDEHTANFKAEHELEAMELLGEHQITYGIEYTHETGSFERLNENYFYSWASAYRDVICNGDTESCVDGDQYFTGRIVYPKAYTDASINKASAYIQDEWDFSRFELRAGLRASYGDFMNNFNVSPRTRLQYDIFDDSRTVVSVGYNRYYDADLLANKLSEGRVPFYVERRDTSQNVVTDWSYSSVTVKSTYNYSSLDTPYKDEFAVGLEQALFGGKASVKYIERRGRSEFATGSELQPDGVMHYFLNNNGSSEYRSAGVKWERSWKIHTIAVNGTWSESYTSNNNYNDIFDLAEMETKIIFNGKTIMLKDLPQDNFSRPLVFNLYYSGFFFNHLRFTTALKYRTPYEQINLVGSVFNDFGEIDPSTGEPVMEYINEFAVVKHKDALTIDCTLSWEQILFRDNKLILTVEVLNILNAKNTVGVSNYSSSTANDTYELGRQFWAGVRYEF